MVEWITSRAFKESDEDVSQLMDAGLVHALAAALIFRDQHAR